MLGIRNVRVQQCRPRLLIEALRHWSSLRSKKSFTLEGNTTYKNYCLSYLLLILLPQILQFMRTQTHAEGQEVAAVYAKGAEPYLTVSSACIH